jgi:hypothetical protein
MTRRDLEPRLLTQGQAAAYCGVCAEVFKKACPVAPVKVLDRIPRYDRQALDAWINGLTKSQVVEEDWLGKLFANDRHGDAGART